MAYTTSDPKQQQAIEALGGYYLVLAPPGCGKTHILANRIAYAHSKGVSFSDMLCLTFTNRASRGMSDRICSTYSDTVGVENIFVGNVHRYAYSFLLNNKLIRHNTGVLDDTDMGSVLATFSAEASTLSTKSNVSAIDNLAAYIAQRRLNHPQEVLFLPEERFEDKYQLAASFNFQHEQIHEELLTQTFKVDPYQYQLLRELKTVLQFMQYKQTHNLITYSDMLILTYEHLRNGSYKKYPWIQVDEVQDLNPLQLAIVDELTDKSQPFTVMYLGDEQQAIFSFIGSKFGQIEVLRSRCDGHIFNLGTNYRSKKYLIDIFNTYATQILDVPTDLLPVAFDAAIPEKHALLYVGNETAEDENHRIFKMVEYYLQFKGEKLGILVAKNRDADRISQALEQGGVPNFKVSGSGIFQSQAYRIFIETLWLFFNDTHWLSWANLLLDIGAFTNRANADNFLSTIQHLQLTPFDVVQGCSYMEAFCEEYLTQEFVLFDTETTGLDTYEDDIVQIAAFKVRRGKRVEDSDFNIFLHTDRTIPSHIGSKVNPLVEEYAQHPHLDRAEGLQRFLDYIGTAPVLGHNVKYDCDILQHNVERTLHRSISLHAYDSLRMIQIIAPTLTSYKLEYLLKELHLEGNNSHLADEDIAATLSLVDYCVAQAQPHFQAQHHFFNQEKTKSVVNHLLPILKLKEAFSILINQGQTVSAEKIVDSLRFVYDMLVAIEYISPLHIGKKFELFLSYVADQLTDLNTTHSNFDALQHNLNLFTSSMSEGDLVDYVKTDTRVFIMTIYKGKGLEFDNIVILGANDNVYPHYSVNKQLEKRSNIPPWINDAERKVLQHEIYQAEQAYQESARLFYVALTRAKKRLCISYVRKTSTGHPTLPTPFMECISQYFRQ